MGRHSTTDCERKFRQSRRREPRARDNSRSARSDRGHRRQTDDVPLDVRRSRRSRTELSGQVAHEIRHRHAAAAGLSYSAGRRRLAQHRASSPACRTPRPMFPTRQITSSRARSPMCSCAGRILRSRRAITVPGRCTTCRRASRRCRPGLGWSSRPTSARTSRTIAPR